MASHPKVQPFNVRVARRTLDLVPERTASPKAIRCAKHGLPVDWLKKPDGGLVFPATLVCARCPRPK